MIYLVFLWVVMMCYTAGRVVGFEANVCKSELTGREIAAIFFATSFAWPYMLGKTPKLIFSFTKKVN